MLQNNFRRGFVARATSHDSLADLSLVALLQYVRTPLANGLTGSLLWRAARKPFHYRFAYCFKLQSIYIKWTIVITLILLRGLFAVCTFLRFCVKQNVDNSIIPYFKNLPERFDGLAENEEEGWSGLRQAISTGYILYLHRKKDRKFMFFFFLFLGNHNFKNFYALSDKSAFKR